MFLAARAQVVSSVATFMAFLFVYMAVSSAYNLSCPKLMSTSCDCLNTLDGYELRCPAFTVQVKPRVFVHIQCDINGVSDFSLLNGTHIGEVDTFVIRLCPLLSVSLSQVMQIIGVSNVSNVHITYTKFHGQFTTTVTRELFHGLSNVTSLMLHNDGFTQLSDNVFNDMHYSSKIISVPSDVFMDLIKLRHIAIYADELLSLPENIFINNPDLEAVKIHVNNQTLKTVPNRLLGNLTKLKNVKLQGFNMSTLPEEILWGSKLINIISLSNNSFTTLPEQLFWDCEELEALDIGFNRITDLPNRLFSKTWNLLFLSINNNQLTVITNYLFAPLSKLEVLDLKYNRLTQIESQAFVRLFSLRAVDMSNNLLTFEDIAANRSMRLSPLRFCNMLEHLQLANNSLTRIFTDWRMLDKLKNLNLAHNRISQIRSTDLIFACVLNWRYFFANLRYNNISKTNLRDALRKYKTLGCTHMRYEPERIRLFKGSPGVYQYDEVHGLKKCHEIVLDKGEIVHCGTFAVVSYKYLTRDLLSDIALNLQTLYIELNDIISIPPDLFVDMETIEGIHIYVNEILSLPQKMFQNNTGLLSVTIQVSRLTLNILPSSLLANLTKLESVELHGCNTSTLPEEFLWGSMSIRSIILNHNAFTTLPELVFRDCDKLETLDICCNKIVDLPKGLLFAKSNLEKLIINNNQLSVITNYLFSSLENLEILDLKDNRLTHIESEAFSRLYSLRSVNMTNNRLVFDDTLTGLSPLKSCGMLEDIQLENNSIAMIFTDWRMLKHLKTLNLARNKIFQIWGEDLQFISTNNTFVNVSYNNISYIDIFYASTDYKYISDSKEYLLPERHIYTEGNPINCNCEEHSFVQHVRYDVTQVIKLIMKSNDSNLQCVKPKEYIGEVVENIPLEFFNCLLKVQYSPNCPEGCKCLIMLSNKTMIIDCHQMNATSELTRVNVLHNLTRIVFSNLHNLMSLDINSSKMIIVPPDLFADLTKLQKINLYANEFINLPQNLFINNTELVNINIQDNKQTLKTIPSSFLGNLSKLKKVIINYSIMSTLPKDIFWGSMAINTISLNNNAFITFPDLLFKICIELQTLDLSFNRITDLPSQFFSNTTNLEVLRINNNQLTVITKYLFLSLGKLKVLDLKDNRLREIDTYAFATLSSLKAVNMSNNLLTFEGTLKSRIRNLSPLNFCGNLTDIQLANNSLTKIFKDWRKLEFLETLNLAHNEISRIQTGDFLFYFKDFFKYTFVNVSYNNISDIDIFDAQTNYMYASVFSQPHLSVRHFSFQGNPINCDCRGYRILPYDGLNFNEEIKLTMQTKLDNSQCVNLEALDGYPIDDIPIKYFSCLGRIENSQNCPDDCNCKLMLSGKALHINCDQRKITMGARKNTLHNITKAFFSNISSLVYLEIYSSKISNIPQDLFIELINLEKIDLYANEFISLPQNLLMNNRILKIFNLHDNRQPIKPLPSRLLADLIKLKVVKLYGCKMSSVPEDLLWGSTSINTIHLHKNAFTTLPDQLFRDCMDLRTLDISFNRITELPEELFFDTINLEILRINNNQLTVIKNFLFSSLEKLRILDLKDNKLTHIETQAFSRLSSLKAVNMSNNMLKFEDILMGLSPLESCSMLEDIQLANNSVSKIFPDWRDLIDLKILNLTHNEINQIRDEDLKFTIPYVRLHLYVDISYNNISEIEFFDNKTIYTYITEPTDTTYTSRRTNHLHFSMRGNPLKCDCKDYTFLPHGKYEDYEVIQLQIDAKPDKLQCINLQSFAGMEVGDIPVIYFNCLGKMEYSLNCPEECTCIPMFAGEELQVECNQRNETLTLSKENMTHSLKEPLLPGEYNSESLDITLNNMSKVPENLFSKLRKLRKIKVNANKWLNLPQNLFKSNPDVEIISLQDDMQTRKTLPSRLLANLTKLKKVKIHKFNISILPDDLLWNTTSLKTLLLNNNAFTTLPELLFKDCTELQTLDVSFNSITDLPEGLFSETRKLKILKLNNNKLTVITNFLFSYLSRLTVLDLKDNKLTLIEVQAFSMLSSLRSVNMSNNMLRFDDKWDYRTLGLSPLNFCSNLTDIQLENNFLSKIFIDWKNLRLLQTLNLAYNKIAQIRAADLHFNGIKNTVINLSYNNISEVNIFDAETFYEYVAYNKKYFVPLRTIFAQGNPVTCDCKLQNLLQHTGDKITSEIKFILDTKPGSLQCVRPVSYSRKPVKNISVTNYNCLLKKKYSLNCPEKCSCVLRIFDKSLLVDCFKRNLTLIPDAVPDIEFSNYTELILSENSIKSVKFPLGSGYYKVTKCILSNNSISEINLTSFSQKLQILKVDGNMLNNFDTPSVEFLINATSLTELTLHRNPWRCDCTSIKFLSAVQSNYHLKKIKSLNNFTCENGRILLEMSGTDLCPVEYGIAVFVSYTVATMGLLFGFSFALYYKYKKAIKVWLYAHRFCLWFVSEAELDEDKLYDAFVSYSHHDEDFVLDHFVPRLENEGYTLCLHLRDWIPGELIPEQIGRSVQESRRTIIVLSPGFLESTWGKLEFHAAHRQALSERRIRVIVMLYGDINPTDKLDPDLQAYLQMNTYIKWGDKWFWDKLRYAMPHNLQGMPLRRKTSD